MPKKRKHSAPKRMGRERAQREAPGQKERRSPPVKEAEVTHYINIIRTFLRKSGQKPISPKELAVRCGGRGSYAFTEALHRMEAQGEIARKHNGYVLSAAVGMIRGTVCSVNRTFGFVRPENGGDDLYVAGKDLKGALPGDLVLVQPMGRSPRGDSPEGSVVTVITESTMPVSGALVVDDTGVIRFLPDTLCRQPLFITNAADCGAVPGDKVLATVVNRGRRHSDHEVRVDAVLGSSDTAKACSKAIVAVSGAPTVFSDAALRDAEAMNAAGILEEEPANRLDLRNSGDVIFTIDGADTKDIDDAISIARTEKGYRLGVHIADVSHYVLPDSPLDADAFARGTSVYYADQVIPMLPKALSNGICSLFPQVDRLALSALMELDEKGEIVTYRFEKTVIRSVVQGVYREVNAIFREEADDSILAKYADVLPSLYTLRELLQVRLAARKQRGAPTLETEESAFCLDAEGVCCGIVPRTRAEAEELIEECMLLANEAAARFARSRNLPFVYRVHELPPEEKVTRLTESLDLLGIAHPVMEKPSPKDYSAVLASVAEHPLKPVVHHLVLRAMAKAAYSPEPLGHFGLALKDYAHFTSPIRRYPDLTVHRMITSAIRGEKLPHAMKMVADAAEQSTRTELRAQNIERDCEERYHAEFMQGHIGEEFDGVISGLTDSGIYVMLANTVEGMISMSELPCGNYDYDGYFTLTEVRSGKKYRFGDAMRVRCIRSDVNSGHIDFAMAE
ncbi:MAG: ribonuclease R [Ruminococcus sp.]|nr:ribonuclease R [Ruminococcus sp.]